LFTLLKAVEAASIDVQTLACDIGLPNAVNRCGKACAHLRTSLDHWTRSDPHSWVGKFQFRRHKKEIQSVAAEISIARQTTILTVVVTQLSIQLKRPVSEEEKFAFFEKARTRIADLKMNQAIRSNESRPLASGRHSSSKGTESGEGGYAGLDQSYEAAATTTRRRWLDISTGKSEQKGDGNVAGFYQQGYEGDLTLKMEETKQDGNNNVIGYSA